MAAEKAAKRPGGRPTSLTPDTQAAILTAVRGGFRLKEAFLLAGLKERTYAYWSERIYKGTAPPYVKEFWDQAKRARVEGMANLVAKLHKASKTSPKYAVALLDRLYPRRFGRQTRTEITGKNGGPLAHTHAGDVGIRVFLPPENRDEPEAYDGSAGDDDPDT